MGNGSVMDTRGRCLLLVNEKGVAKVIDKQGKAIAEYKRGGAWGDSIDNRSPDSSRSPISIPSQPSLPESDNKHAWKFDGLHVEFYPSTWEVGHFFFFDQFFSSQNHFFTSNFNI